MFASSGAIVVVVLRLFHAAYRAGGLLIVLVAGYSICETGITMDIASRMDGRYIFGVVL